MGGTALKRKARRNKTKVKIRKASIKLQGFKPVIRSIDKEAIKLEFAKSKAKPTPKKEEVNAEKVDNTESTEKTAKIADAAPKKEVKTKTTEGKVKSSTDNSPAKTKKKSVPKAKKETAPKSSSEETEVEKK